MAVTEQVIVRAQWEGRDLERGTRKAERDLNRMQKAASRVGKAMKAAALGAAALVGAAIIAGAGALANRMGTLASRSEAVAGSFERIARGQGRSPGAILREIDDAARGTLSSIDAMTLATGTLTTRLPTLTDNMGQIIRDVRAVSVALGRDATVDIQRFFEAVAKGEPELLDELRVVVRVEEANRRMAEQLGKTTAELSDYEKRNAFAALAVEKLRGHAEQLGEPIDRQAEAVARAAAQWENLQAKLGRFVQGASGGLFGFLGEQLERLNIALETTPERLERLGATAGIIAAARAHLELKNAIEERVRSEARLRDLAARPGAIRPVGSGAGQVAPNAQQTALRNFQLQALQSSIPSVEAAIRDLQKAQIAILNTSQELTREDKDQLFFLQQQLEFAQALVGERENLLAVERTIARLQEEERRSRENTPVARPRVGPEQNFELDFLKLENDFLAENREIRLKAFKDQEINAPRTERIQQTALKNTVDWTKETENFGKGAELAFARYAMAAQQSGKLAEDFVLRSLNTMEDAFARFITGQRVSLGDLFRQVAADFARLQFRQASASLLADLGIASFHQGGIVPGHSGQNVPAVLQAGELVLTKEQTRMLAGRGTTVNVTIQAQDAASFRRSQDQIGRDLVGSIRRAERNN